MTILRWLFNLKPRITEWKRPIPPFYGGLPVRCMDCGQISVTVNDCVVCGSKAVYR